MSALVRMAKSNQGIVLALTAVVAGVVVGYSLLIGNTPANPSKRKGEQPLAPALTELEAIAVMNAVMGRVKSLTILTMDNAKKIKNDIEAQGHQVDNDVLRQTYILPAFEKGFGDIQLFVFNEFDVDEEEVAEAVDYYIKAGNPELKKIKEGIRKVFKMFGGDLGADEEEEKEVEEEELGSGEAEDDDDDNYEDVDEEDGALAEEDVLSILEILAEKMVGHTNVFAEEFKRKYGLPNTPDLMDAFLQGITTLSEEAEKLVLISAEVTQEEFQTAFHNCQEKGSIAIENTVKKMKADNKALLRAQGIMI